MNRFSLFQCDPDSTPHSVGSLEKALNRGEYASVGSFIHMGPPKEMFMALPVDARSIWIDMQNGSLRCLDAFGSSDNPGHLLTLLGYPDVLESLENHEATPVIFHVPENTNLHGALARETTSELTFAQVSARLTAKKPFYFVRPAIIRLFIDVMRSVHEHNRDTPERPLEVSDVITGMDVLIESRPPSVDHV